MARRPVPVDPADPVVGDPRADGQIGVKGRNPASDLLVYIRGAVPSLQPSEKRVAAAVLADPATAATLSITMLAEQAQTSVTTVMRFCRAVGLSSYSQLRLALAGAAAREVALGGENRYGTADISTADSLADVVGKIVHHEARALEETGANLDIETLSLAVDAIAGARRIDIFGIGASGFVGLDLHQKLHRVGLLAFVWTDAHAALTAAALLRPTDVAIGISHSGATLDTVEPLRAAGRNGATTIALTNFGGSAITDRADLVLTTAARETPFRAGATVSRIAQLAVVDCLFVGVAQRFYDAAAENLNNTFEAVRHRRLHPAPAADAPLTTPDRGTR